MTISRQTRWQRRKIAERKCSICGKSAPKGSRCKACGKKRRLKQREKKGWRGQLESGRGRKPKYR